MKISYKINFIDLKRVLKLYIPVIIPIIAVFILLTNFISNTQTDKAKRIITETQKQRMRIMKYIIPYYFTDIRNNSLLIKNSDDIALFLQTGKIKADSEAEKLFHRVIKSLHHLMKITLTDSSGQEVLNIQKSSNNSNFFENGELTDCSNLPYYKEASSLPAGDIFFSNIFLKYNSDTSKGIASSLIKLAIPLYAPSGIYRGTLAMDWSADTILQAFSQQFADNEYSFLKSALINQNGEYLYSSNNNHEDILTGKAANSTLNREYPQLWQKIKSQDFGIFEDDSELLCFQKFSPLASINTPDRLKFSWIILSSFDLKNIPFINQKTFLGINISDLILLLSICIFVLIGIIIYYIHSKHKEQLNITTRIARETSDAVVITDKETRILYVNKAFENATGYTSNEVIGLKTNHFKSGKHPTSFYKNMWDNLNNSGYWHGELWDKKKDGMFYPKRLSIIAVGDSSNTKVYKYIGIFTDLTQIKEQQNTVTRLKNYNMDTDLPNETLLKKLIQKSINSQPEKFGLICFSIANFNRLLIRNAEDLQSPISTLINSIKKLLGDNDFIAQISKSIFVIGITINDNQQNIEDFIRLFIEQNKKIHHIDNDEIYFEIKAGISLFPRDGDTPNQLVNNAYFALETSLKDKNTGNYLFYYPELRESLEKELQIDLLLRSAIENNELDVHYQPQVDSITERIIGAEALMRWNNPKLGSVPPFIFIPMAENTGLIIEIGYWLIERVFQDYQKLRGSINNSFRISINISPLQFMDSNLIPEFKALAERYNVALHNFEIEITEGILINDIKTINSKLKEFRNLGISIAIDDFGTGFSSLSYLKNLNIDKLKIDRSFIKDYPQNDNGTIAKVVANIAYDLNLNVLAEGAETQDQVKYLASVGCSIIQGYYYSKPLPYDDFAEFISRMS